VLITALLVALGAGGMTPQKPDPLLDTLASIRTRRFVDLTQAFAPGIPHWHGVPDEVRETLSHYDQGVGTQGSGFLIHPVPARGPGGTHVDPLGPLHQGSTHPGPD
jgi:hypothetical protein